MTVTSPLSPVSAAIFAALNVPALTALVPAGVFDKLPQGVSFPCVLIEVDDEYDPPFGARPGLGAGSMSEVTLRAHVFSQYGGMKECQAIAAVMIGLLANEPTVAGYHAWQMRYLRTQMVGDELVGGVRVEELVVEWAITVEEAA